MISYGLSNDTDPVQHFLLLLLFACAGLCFGSFSSAIIYREERHLPWFKVLGEQKRSACPNCGHLLGFWDLIPVFSWLFLAGKCRFCKSQISPLYPALEIIACGMAVFIFLSVSILTTQVLLLCAVPFLIAGFYLFFKKKFVNLRSIALGLFFLVLAAVTSF